LHEERSKGDGWPVYVLEHGLDKQEIKDLELAVQTDIKNSPPSDKYWLPWIVYSSEIGYEYEGLEYWQTFEENTPGWIQHGDRYWIREKFREFSHLFGGARPLGSWAQHFTIICWPITHAILPKDLQRQLARTLYDIRYSFTASTLQSPDWLSKQILLRSSISTTRFQQFAQDAQLVRQIATALLFHEDKLGRSLILPKTLQRIVDNLEQERGAREWLRSARSSVSRIELQGLSKGNTTQSSSVFGPKEARSHISGLGIEPQLILLPLAESSWQLHLQLPDFSPLLARFPTLRNVFMDSRCIVMGSSGRPLARGRLLNNGSQYIPLSSWPNPGDVLLQFEEQIPKELEYLLKTECLLRPGPTWLCRIASDGKAHELRSSLVRQQQSYIVLSSTSPLPPSSFTSPVSISCEGLYGARLNVPSDPSAECLEYLKDAGLNLTKGIQVWPAGIAACDWDGHGRGEWLSTEEPCIGILIDHPIDGLLIILDEKDTLALDVKPKQIGKPIFVQLPKLLAGPHRLRVTTRSQRFYSRLEEMGQLDVMIRQPRPWVPQNIFLNAFTITADPIRPSLEQMRSGRVEVEISGPEGRQIRSSLVLFGKSKATLLSKNLPLLTLPVNVDNWQKYIVDQFKAKDIQSHIDSVYSCEINLDGEELGNYTFVCEHDFTPLRWSIKRTGQGYLLTLADDTGSCDQTKVGRFDFETPDLLTDLPYSTDSISYRVPQNGGLYIARNVEMKVQCSVIVPREVRTLQCLREATPRIRQYQRNNQSLSEILTLVELWSDAPTGGNVFAERQRLLILHALINRIYELVYGKPWVELEATFLSNQKNKPVQDLSRGVFKSIVDKRTSALRRFAEHEHTSAMESVTRFRGFVQDFIHLPKEALSTSYIPGHKTIGPKGVRIRYRNQNLCTWLAEFALRLASAPHTLRRWAGDRLNEGLCKMLELPELARSARFLVVETYHHLDGNKGKSYALFYTGWEWQ
jgi:hypothetical protein